jgi:hypothetical protein
MPTPYETDIALWAQEQAALLDARQFDALDIPHLIEELLAVPNTNAAVISGALFQILVHLLKWRYQPERRSHSWEVSLIEHRARVPRRLDRAPSLARELPAMVTREYPGACRKASAQTRLPLSTFPPTCPWTVAQILDFDFFPAA